MTERELRSLLARTERFRQSLEREVAEVRAREEASRREATRARLEHDARRLPERAAAQTLHAYEAEGELLRRKERRHLEEACHAEEDLEKLRQALAEAEARTHLLAERQKEMRLRHIRRSLRALEDLFAQKQRGEGSES